MKTLASFAAAACLSGFLASSLAAQAVQVDRAIPEYKPVQGVSGNLKSIGSDSMNNEMTLWGEGFKGLYPNVKIEIEGKGSSTAPPALISGTSHFGPMSREMKSDEIDKFEKQFGHKPVGLPTSIDMLAVYVHKDNPIAGLTLQQVDAIFSKTRKGGLSSDIRTWGDLGLTGEWANKPISLYGRNSASGTYGYFKENALFKGDYKDEVKEQPGSSSVVQGVASDKYGIGYSGIGYKTADVRPVPLAAQAGEAFVEATPDNGYSGDYPLARYLLLYLNHKPGTQLDPLRREFVRYVFSKQGQSEVVKDGYLPVPAKIATEALRQVGLQQTEVVGT
ncbi:MAG: PstS family phosphate ABC transporter substrate-binding protein [Planctomycetota bacterium]